MIPLILSQTLLTQTERVKTQVKDVNLAVSKDVAPSDKIRININSQNVRSITLTAKPINGEKWLAVQNRKTERPGPFSGATHTWSLAMATKDQKPNPNQSDTFYTRQINLPKLNPGVYLLEASGGDKPAWAVVNVTDLAVVVKRSTKHALVWVTDFKTGKTVPDAAVRYVSPKGQLEEAAQTKADGTALISVPPGDGTFVIRRGHDLAGISSQQEETDGVLRAHFETDRPTYRPGQRISFKAILRRTLGTGYRTIQNSDCLVQLRDPKDNAIEEFRLRSNAMGTVSGEVSIPGEGMTGPYSLVLYNGKDSTFQTLSVADYRKPEFKVEVKPAQKRYLAGNEVTFEVDSAYYFGAPVPQAQVHFVARRSGMPFGGYDPVTQAFYSGDGNLYSQDTYQANAMVGDDNVFTDDKGKVFIHLKTDPNIGDATYSIACTVTDASHRQVESESSVPVYGAAVRLGLGTNLSYATLGALIPVSIHLADLDGKPANGPVTLELKRLVYDEKTSEYKEVLVTSTTAKVGPSGGYSINLPARNEGELRIYGRVPDGSGRFAHSLLTLYVAGNYEAPAKEKEEPKISVRLDKREYKPDETAKALVETNNPKLPVLAVAEGADIWDYQVLEPGRGAGPWNIRTGLRLSPNAYATAAQWVKGELVSANAEMPVPDRSKALRVTVSADKSSYRPGDQATYRIHTEDGNGKPTSAEVALGVVDEAIYAIGGDQTDDLYRFYWGLRPDAVSMLSSAPEELSGGAYQRVSALAPVRQRFEDTAYWSPTVSTDAHGNAQVQFEMPGNLTTWRATARAVTLDTSVGGGVSKVIATRPVTLRLATPRQMVVGDKLTVIGTVDNRSSSEHVFDVRLDGTGVQIEGERNRQLHLAANSEGKVEWTLVAPEIPITGLASLSGQVEAHDIANPDFADALRMSLPVTPNGLSHRSIVGGSFTKTARASFDLPADRIEPASKVKVTVRLGLRPLFRAATSSVLDSGLFGTESADNQLETAAILDLPSIDEHVRESLALLARIQSNEGWGWWAGACPDAALTARTLLVLAECRYRGIHIFDNLYKAALESSVMMYQQNNLWEDRALLASSITVAGDDRGEPLLQEVEANGTKISPYALLRLAEGEYVLHHHEEAKKILTQVLANVDSGPEQAYLPAGDGAGWSGTDIETTAEALYMLGALHEDEELQGKFARWLAAEDQAWRSSEEDCAVARALVVYLRTHREDSKLGPVAFTINGVAVVATPSTVDQSVSAQIPVSVLKNGDNKLVFAKASDGQAFFSVESKIFLPDINESTKGIRVLRRFEVKNPGGTWVELDRPVAIGEPVRCTVLAWGDNYRDAIQLTEPIPAGFEFVEDQSPSQGDQEVRDGAVVDYLINSTTPQVFSYYLRSESTGRLTALPALAEYTRRPRLRGNTPPQKLTVVDAK